MNPAFILLVIIAAILVWVLCVFVFAPLGSVIKKYFNKLNKTINEEDVDKEDPNDGETQDEQR